MHSSSAFTQPGPPGPPDPPDVPGYRLGAPLGTGAGGQVWSATDDSGGRFAVKVVERGPDAERELAVLRAVRHEHVVSWRDAVPLAGGLLALVTDLLDGGTLAQVVAARGRLTPGEVVTVVAPLAQAVADLHAQGIQHGDLAPGNVLFDGVGKPVLADLGTVRVTGLPRDEEFGTAGYVDPVVLTGGPGGPASDVYGLGALAWFALCGAPPDAVPYRPPLRDLVPAAGERLTEAVEAALAADPETRPAPGEHAGALHAAAPATPVWRAGLAPADGGLTHRVRVLTADDGAPHQPRHRRERARRLHGRRPRRRTVLVSGLTAGLLACAAAVWAWHPGQPAQAAALPAAGVNSVTRPVDDVRAITLRAEDVRPVVRALARARAAALASPEAGPAPDTGSQPDSTAAEEDARNLAALRAAGVRYHGLQLTPRSVRLVSSRPGRAVVDVVLDASAYDVVDAGGSVVRRVPAARGAPTRLTLVGTGDGWRVSAVAQTASRTTAK